MDKDTRSVVELLDAALSASGLTAAGFAMALGTSASRFSTYRSGQTKPTGQFCMRARRIGTALGAARARRLMSSLDTAAAIASAADEEWRWRMLMQGRDHLRLMLQSGGDAAACWEPAPGPTGSSGLDTLLAALTALEFSDAAEEAPSWCRDRKSLDVAWIPEHPFFTREEVIAATPPELARLNVFVPARDLVTA
jgi:hypothetical protein